MSSLPYCLLDFKWFGVWRKPDIEFITPLSIEECQTRLKRALQYERGIFGPKSKKPVIGETYSTHFRIYKTSRFCRTDFWPFLYGRLNAVPQGTSVQVSFVGNRIYIAISWILYVGLGLCGTASKVIGGQASLMGALLFLAAFWGCMALFIGVTSRMAKSHRDYTLNYLRRILADSTNVLQQT